MAWGDSQVHFLACTVAHSRSYSEKRGQCSSELHKIKREYVFTTARSAQSSEADMFLMTTEFKG